MGLGAGGGGDLKDCELILCGIIALEAEGPGELPAITSEFSALPENFLLPPLILVELCLGAYRGQPSEAVSLRPPTPVWTN